MNIIDWINGKRLNIDTVEFDEKDGFIIIPSWQFALFLSDYREKSRAMLTYAFLFVALVFIWLWQLWM